MKPPSWLKAKRTITPAQPAPHGTVTVTIEADISRFVAGMADAQERIADLRYGHMMVSERLAARRHLDRVVDAAWARYGWQRPEPVDPFRSSRRKWLERAWVNACPRDPANERTTP